MTCEEFVKLAGNVSPADMTGAERFAVIRHMDDCLACRTKVQEIAEKELARTGGVIPPIVQKHLDIAVRKMDRDIARGDPEL